MKFKLILRKKVSKNSVVWVTDKCGKKHHALMIRTFWQSHAITAPTEKLNPLCLKIELNPDTKLRNPK